MFATVAATKTSTLVKGYKTFTDEMLRAIFENIMILPNQVDKNWIISNYDSAAECYQALRPYLLDRVFRYKADKMDTQTILKQTAIERDIAQNGFVVTDCKSYTCFLAALIMQASYITVASGRPPLYKKMYLQLCAVPGSEKYSHVRLKVDNTVYDLAANILMIQDGVKINFEANVKNVEIRLPL
jgi:hypothetical protein